MKEMSCDVQFRPRRDFALQQGNWGSISKANSQMTVIDRQWLSHQFKLKHRVKVQPLPKMEGQPYEDNTAVSNFRELCPHNFWQNLSGLELLAAISIIIISIVCLDSHFWDPDYEVL